MDVPARQAYVMSVVPEEERSAAASVTNVPRSFGGAFGVWLAGPLLAAGAFPLALALGGGLQAALRRAAARRLRQAAAARGARTTLRRARGARR